jgi:hypothetical protein
MMMGIDWKALSAPFKEDEIKIRPTDIRPKGAKNATAQPLQYIDARLVMNRLDEVVGPENWEDKYELLEASGAVVCTISIRIGDPGAYSSQWLSKSDVGKESAQDDKGDKVKAAFSDAFKRAAVKFGIGRHLYDEKLPRRPYNGMDKHWIKDRVESDAPEVEGFGTNAAPPSSDPRITDMEYANFLTRSKEVGADLGALRKMIGRLNLARMTKVEYDKIMKDWDAVQGVK